MKKKLILSGLITFLICSGCGKLQEDLPLPETKEPPQNSSPTILPSPTVSASSTITIPPTPTPTLTPTPTSTPTPSPSMTIRFDDSSSPLNPSISYLEISPEFGLTIYISQDIAWQQIVLYRDHTYYNYYWDYDLAYGEPIVFFLNRPMEGERKLIKKELVICFPTEELKEPLSQIGAREICGEAHMLDYENLAYEIPQSRQFSSSTIAFSQNASGENLFSLFNVDGEAYMEFPGLNAEEFGLSKQKLYPLRFDSLHYTDTGMCYQRVGIKEEEKMVWIGKFCWYTLFADETIGYRINNKRGFADGPYEKEWQLRPLEPDALLDLDGDGTAEKICSRFVIGEGSHSNTFQIWINGIEQHIKLVGELDTTLYTASLDGKTSQIIALNHGVGRSNDLEIFQYKEGELQSAGCFLDGEYQKIESEKGNIYISKGEAYPLQNEYFDLKQEFVDGALREVPQDFYTFKSRNIITTKQAIELYTKKNESETFLLPQGSSIVFLGSDLSEWILVENQDTKEKGWLRVEMKNWDGLIMAFNCIFPDGSKIEKEKLFDGLMNYD